MIRRLLIFDDNEAQAQQLRSMVERYHRASEFEIGIATTPPQLRQRIAADEIDVLLMDINIDDSDKNGIELVSENLNANSPMQVIYITGFDAFHTSVYRTQHTGFLLKPPRQEELDEALDNALTKLAQISERPFWVRTATGEKVINPRYLRYAESSRRICKLHVNDEVIETYCKLSDLMQMLPQRFIQCHKSFLVNMGFIDELGRQNLQLTTGEKIPVSQMRRAEVRKSFFDYVGRSIV